MLEYCAIESEEDKVFFSPLYTVPTLLLTQPGRVKSSPKKQSSSPTGKTFSNDGLGNILKVFSLHAVEFDLLALATYAIAWPL